MPAKRIIPCLDVDKGKVLKGRRFKNLRYAGDPVKLASKYSLQGADEIVFLDITASIESRQTMIDVVRKVASEVDIPLTVGGGIKDEKSAEALLTNGADKVSINTAAVYNPSLITKLSDIYGRQCIIVAIDAKKDPRYPSGYQVYTHSGRTPTGIDALLWAKRCVKLGAGEILLTSIDADGLEDGYDLKLTKIISENVNVPVIASGGAGSPEHIYQVLIEGKADAALAATIFHYDYYSIPDVKEFLRKRGIEVRV